MRLLPLLLICCGPFLFGQAPISYLDIYDIEYARNPSISPDGTKVLYERRGFDIMSDKSTSTLWMHNLSTKSHSKVSHLVGYETNPIWSNNGKKAVFTATVDGEKGIYSYDASTQKVNRIAILSSSASDIVWSKDDKWLAYTMFVEEESPVIAKMPKAPKGANWAPPARITDRLKHEADGRGYVKPGNKQIFIMAADGGAQRRITTDSYPLYGPLSWESSGDWIYFSGKRFDDHEYQIRESEIYKVHTKTFEIERITDRDGPDYRPTLSPNGNMLAYLGYDDKIRAHQVSQIYIKNLKTGKTEMISGDFDRDPETIVWSNDSKHLYIAYDSEGNTKIGKVSLSGKVTELVGNVGGTTLGRPYPSGSFSVSNAGKIVYTQTTPDYPAQLAIYDGRSTLIGSLNENMLPFRTMGKTEEIWYNSSIDDLKIQGWVVYPPNYDASKKYPLLIENHGGPILNYGDRFSFEMQLYAAAGYVVFYPNARGSTSYGEAFADKLYHNYPNEDAQDVLDGMDFLINKGIIDTEQLFVTGGSAGGIMAAWLIGISDRFAAAVVAKPVVNWISKTLVADNYFYYADYRMPGQPWESVETYWKFSPISLVEKMNTPTMVMVGMNDLRTPPSEAKQLYHALKLRKQETVLVEIPEASHGIANKPSNLISKIAHTLAWFEKYRKE